MRLTASAQMALLFVLLVKTFPANASSTTPPRQPLPVNLQKQVDKLANLIADGNAESCCAEMQTLRLGDGSDLILLVFTLEGFGGGNNWIRYLAVFSPQRNKRSHVINYQLRDVVNTGNDFEAQIEEPDAKIIREDKMNAQTRSVTFSITKWLNANGAIGPKDHGEAAYFMFDGQLRELKSLNGGALPRKSLNPQ